MKWQFGEMTTHPLCFQYLGESQSVAGRMIFDETLIEDLPIISKSGIILMPGQTIPITFFHVRLQSGKWRIPNFTF